MTDEPDGGEPHRTPLRRRSPLLIAWVALAVSGIALVLALTGRRTPTAHVPLTVVPSSRTVELLTRHTITGAGAQSPHHLVFTHGELRVVSSAGDTDENQRELWTFANDESDVDLTTLVGIPSSLGGQFKPQPGIALRYRSGPGSSGRAIVIDANVWSGVFNRLMVGYWTWPTRSDTGIEIRQLATPLILHGRQTGVVAAARRAGHPSKLVYWVDPSFSLDGPGGFQVGEHVDISFPAEPDYERTDAVITAVDAVHGTVTVEQPDATTDGPVLTTNGTIQIHYAKSGGQPPDSLYPRYIRARIVGSTLQVKTWLAGLPEPGWQLTTTIPASWDVPASGNVGLVANHLYGAGQYIAFGDVTITPIATP
ncbi:MAG: hypothetical protein JST73_02125 [Actinobacteria bacterium]|nr:hypothetical protein [Actinomycetota bacterium]